MLRRAGGTLLPVEEHAAVAVGEAPALVDAEADECAVDPVAAAFQLCKVADGGFVDDEVAVAFCVAVLGAVFFVAKDGRVAEFDEDGAHGLAVEHLRFSLEALLVGGGVVVVGGRALVGDDPLAAVLAHAQDLAGGEQVPIGGVEEGVAFQGALRLKDEAAEEGRLLKAFKVGDAELELDFRLGHGHEYRAGRAGGTLHVRRRGRLCF